MKLMLVLHTQRLQLRRFHINDAEAMISIFGDAEVMKYGNGILSQDQVERWIENAIISYKEFGYGPFAVELRANKKLIGYCGLFHFPDVDGQPETEIGYRLAKSFWGKGYATEAAFAVRDHAFNTLDIKRLVALIDPSNMASIRVAAKLSMSYEKDVMLDGYTYPDHLYTLSRTE